MFNPQDLAYQESSQSKNKLPKLPKLPPLPKPGKKAAVIISSLLVVSLLATGGYFYFQSRQTPKETPDQLADKEMRLKVDKLQNEQKQVINIVDKQIPLPKNEEPFFATVSDENAVKNQEFFQDALVGDRILMYPKNKKAYLYRPSIQKVLATAPLQYGNTAVAGTSSATLDTPGQSIGEGRVIVEPNR